MNRTPGVISILFVGLVFLAGALYGNAAPQPPQVTASTLNQQSNDELSRRVATLEAQVSALADRVDALENVQAPVESTSRTLVPPPVDVSEPTTTGGANIRTGPGTDYGIMRSVGRGTRLNIVGYNDDGNGIWYALADGGWISGTLVDSAPADAPYVPAPASQAPAPAPPSTPTSPPQPPQPAQGCPSGGCTMYPDWCAPPIKGNISQNTGERIYHVPGGAFYDATVIRPQDGERWFCTEGEARAAGWRRSMR